MSHARAVLNMTNLPLNNGQAYPFINHIKNCTQNGQVAAFTLDGSLVDANGYLTTAPASQWGAGVQLPPYSGSWVCKWTGTAEAIFIMDVVGFTISVGGGFVSSSTAGSLVDVAGTNARVVFKPSAPSTSAWTIHFPSTGTYSGWSNFVLCRDIDETAVDAGELFYPPFSAALKLLNPGVLRFMQWNGIIGGIDSQPFTYGNNKNTFTYTGSQYPSSLWGGTVSSSLVSGVRTYTCSKPSGLSGSIVAGEMILGNVSDASVETSTVTITNASPAVVTWTGSNFGVDTAITIATTGALPTGITAFNGSSNSVYYVISAGANSFQISLTKGGAAVNTSSAGSGTHTATAYRPCVLNAGARGSKPLVFNGDIMNGDITARQLTTTIQASQVHLFTYDPTLDAYCFTNPTAGIQGIYSCPVSVEVALCNKIKSDFYYCFPTLISDAEVPAIVAYVSDNLDLSLNFHVEYTNERWNPGTSPQSICRSWATKLGLPSGIDAFAKRHCEVMALAKTAWSPRSASQLKRILGAAIAFDGDPVGFKGVLFEGSNLSAYGFNASPNRPVDRSEGSTLASYFEGPNTPVGSVAGNGGYVATGQEGLYTAADNFALNTPAGIAAGLLFVDNDLRSGTGGSGDPSTLAWLNGRYLLFEAMAAGYDASRATLGQAPLFIEAYEGGMQGAIFPSAALLNGLGLNGSLYGDATGRIALLFDAYKHSSLFKQLCYDFFANFTGTGGSINASLPHFSANCWYNFCGDASKWSMYPGDLASTPFQSFNAMQQFDLVGTRNLRGNF